MMMFNLIKQYNTTEKRDKVINPSSPLPLPQSPSLRAFL